MKEPYKNREYFLDYFVEVIISPNQNHPDNIELSIYLHNTKTNETVLRADSSHNLDDGSGKWPFHIHHAKSDGRDFFIVINR